MNGVESFKIFYIYWKYTSFQYAEEVFQLRCVYETWKW